LTSSRKLSGLLAAWAGALVGSFKSPNWMAPAGQASTHAGTESPAKISDSKVKTLAAGMGWFLLTAMVLRTCHHWAQVEWNAESLFASRLTHFLEPEARP